MNIAVFPGQGSQFVGMGIDIYNKYDSIKELFNRVEKISGIDISKVIFNGPLELLKETRNAQLAIMLTSISILEVLKEKKIEINNIFDFLAGHSLGEYTALVAASSLKFEDAIRILKVRGEAMEKAYPKGQGGMLAILGVNDLNIINAIVKKASIETGKICSIANNNSIGQVILSGDNKALSIAEKIAKEEYNIRIVKRLEVSGPFHSQLMVSAQKDLVKVLDDVEFYDCKIPIISNVNAKPYVSKHDIKKMLIEQIISPVKWCESMIYATSKGVGTIIEIGPSKVLSGLMKRIDNKVLSVNIETDDDIKNFILKFIKN